MRYKVDEISEAPSSSSYGPVRQPGSIIARAVSAGFAICTEKVGHEAFLHGHKMAENGI